MEWESVYGSFLIEEDYDIEKTVFIFDSSTLLNMFRSSENLADEYMKAIKKVKKRIHIPYLVGVEYFFNKDNVTKNLNESSKDFGKEVHEALINKSIGEIDTMFKKLGLDANNEIKEIKKDLKKNVKKTFNDNHELYFENITKELSSIKDKREEVESFVTKIIINNCGEKLKSKDIDEIQKEGIERYALKIPPGYDDDKKGNIRSFGELKYEQKYGDLIIWKEILKYSKSSDLPNICFVTSDGISDKKTDWLCPENRARIELVEEMRDVSNKKFYVNSDVEFIKKVLPPISEYILKEAQELSEYRNYIDLNYIINDNYFIESIQNYIERNISTQVFILKFYNEEIHSVDYDDVNIYITGKVSVWYEEFPGSYDSQNQFKFLKMFNKKEYEEGYLSEEELEDIKSIRNKLVQGEYNRERTDRDLNRDVYTNIYFSIVYDIQNKKIVKIKLNE